MLAYTTDVPFLHITFGLTLLGALAPHTHAGWFASPTGSPASKGTIDRPWDLQTALSGGNGLVHPGDTVWLRGGTYRGTFTAKLTGTATAPVVVRQYPGERATIDGGSSDRETFTVDGRWAIYWGFEITQSGIARFCTECLGLRPTGVYVRGAANVKLVNLIVHDVGHGTYTENHAHDIEIYGWIIYNGGNENLTRSDGHGIYIKNDGVGWKVARDNVIFNQFGFGIHGYTEVSSGMLENIVLDGNVVFNNGTVSSFDNNANLQLGGQAVADNDTISDNMLYFSPWVGWVNVRMGFNSVLNGSALFKDNYIVGGRQAMALGHWRNLSMLANTMPNESGASAAAVQAPRVFVRPNRYEAGRATVVIYNWSHQVMVPVDLRGILPPGRHYTVKNVQDIFGEPVVQGIYRGGMIAIPMTGVTPPVPVGGSPKPPLRTAPAFDVFMVN